MRTRTTLVLACALSGCVDRDVSAVEPEGDRVFTTTIPLDLRRQLDLLFVVDNSGSMAGEQASLAAQFPRFMDILARVEGGAPDLHIGVVTSDVGAVGRTDLSGACRGEGDDGLLQLGRAGCPAVGGRFLVDAPDGAGRATNYTGALADAFACMAQVGTDGCGFEMHLEAMRRALSPDHNPGFLRPDATLGVIVIADEDDCSAADGALLDPATGTLGPLHSFRCFAEGVVCDQGDLRSPGRKTGCRPAPASRLLHEVDEYVEFLHRLKARPGKLVVAGIIGPGGERGDAEVVLDPERTDGALMVRPSCDRDPTRPDDEAAPPFRLAGFLSRFPESVSTSICADSLATPLERIARLMAAHVGSRCVGATLADRDPATPALEPTCSVTELLDPAGARDEHVLPACETGRTPCWKLEVDAAACPAPVYPQSLELVIDRGGAPPPASSELKVQCVVAAPPPV